VVRGLLKKIRGELLPGLTPLRITGAIEKTALLAVFIDFRFKTSVFALISGLFIADILVSAQCRNRSKLAALLRCLYSILTALLDGTVDQASSDSEFLV
jgi:hypothetical protein